MLESIRSMIGPADRVMGCLSVCQAIQMLSLWYMMSGLIAMLAMFTTTEAQDPKHTYSQTTQVLRVVQDGFNIFAFWVGCKGYLGSTLKIISHIQVLLVYIVLYAVFSIVRLLRLGVICEEIPETKCKDLHTVVLMSSATDFLWSCYFAYIAWSYMIKLEDGSDLPRFIFDEAFMNTGAMPLQYQNMNPSEGTNQGVEQPVSGALSAPGGTANHGPRNALQPFSGHGYRLE